jgi:ABC-type dipeptide/oligopeptide/nickel transport system permease subunit
VIGLGVAGPWFAPYNPAQQFSETLLLDNGLPAGASHAHWFGGDVLARDELSRLLYGARISIAVALISTLIATLLGVAVGMMSGFFGGTFDTVAMRAIDLALSLPFLLIAIVLQRVWSGSGIWSLCLILGLLSWMGLARITRAETMQIKQTQFVLAARTVGTPLSRLFLRHILPNIAGPIVAICTLMIARMILAESALSFLGLGVRPPTASWGSMLNDSQALMIGMPRLMLYPATLICMSVFGFNLLGEALRDAFDPKSDT